MHRIRQICLDGEHTLRFFAVTKILLIPLLGKLLREWSKKSTVILASVI